MALKKSHPSKDLYPPMTNTPWATECHPQPSRAAFPGASQPPGCKRPMAEGWENARGARQGALQTKRMKHPISALEVALYNLIWEVNKPSISPKENSCKTKKKTPTRLGATFPFLPGGDAAVTQWWRNLLISYHYKVRVPQSEASGKMNVC